MVETFTGTAASRSGSDDIVEILKARMIDHALPLCPTGTLGSHERRFIDRLSPDGRADHLAPRRVFVQTRQIH